MQLEQIYAKILQYSNHNKKMFVSTSLQTHSIPLLHLLKESNRPITYLFINTGFHFPETLTFKKEIETLLDIKIKDVVSAIPKSQQKDEQGNFYFSSDPSYCCTLNKTQPLEPYLINYDVWINGVRAGQSAARKMMDIEQETPFNAKRFHPILDWTAKDIYEYRMKHNLPEHPLDSKGYQSIGCAPCTRKFDANDERSARWFGMNKTECGLHTDLISK